MTRRFHSSAAEYAVAVAVVAAAVALRMLLYPSLGASLPYLFFYPAVVIAAWYGGLGPGLVATLLAAIASTYWIVAPGHLFAMHTRADVLRLAVFVAVGILVAWLNENLHRAAAEEQAEAERLRRQYEDLAALAHAQLAAIVESSDDAIVGKSLDRRITSWNLGAERLFGFTAAEAIGQSIAIIVPPDRLEEEERVIDRVRTGERVLPFETVRVRKDGTRLDVSVTVSPIRNPSGEIVGASKIARDISARKQEERLREQLLARERAAHEDAIAARDRLKFLADVSAVLTSSLQYEATFDRAAHLALPLLGDYCNILVQEDDGQLRRGATSIATRNRCSPSSRRACSPLKHRNRRRLPMW